MKNKTLSLGLMAMMLVFSMAIQAQITGTVLEEGTGDPVIGASILQVGTTNGVITDFDGNFELNVPEGTQIQISYMGFQTQTLPAKKGMVVKLAEDSHQLQEVVAIGYGSQKKKEVTGSVTSVKAEDFNPGVKSDPMGLLQGRVAGLTVIRTGGDDPTNTGFAVQIRGTSSLGKGTGGTPLYIVDGVPVSVIDNIAPEEIASMDVLKDGSAAAIYGTRGTNGVVIITTKRGVSDPNLEKGLFNLEYSGYVSAATVATSTGMANAEQYRNIGTQTGGWIRTTDHGNNTDWYGALLHTAAITHHHNVAIAGASRQFSYRAAIGYKNAEGIVKKNNREEIQAKFAADQSAFEGWLKLQYDFSYMHYRNDKFCGDLTAAATLNPTYPIYNADGSYFEPSGTVTANPVADNEQQESYQDGNAFHGSFKAIVDIKAVPGLKVSGFAALDETDWYGYYRAHKDYYKKDARNKAQRQTSRTFNQLYEGTIDYAGQWGGHTLTAVGGASYQKFWSDWSEMWNGNFATDASGFYSIGDAVIDKDYTKVSSGRSENVLIAFFARANYNYKEKYLLSASLRAEASSKFGANHKWGFFPAASAGWRIKGEDFMRDQDWCNDLKVRFGFGITGNNVSDPLQSLEMMSVGGMFNNHGEPAYSYTVARNANPDLRWEKKYEYNLGVDFSFLQNRLSGTMDFYLRNTKDLLWLYTVPTPPYQYGELLANAGEITAMGMEYAITGIPVKTKDWEWASTITLSFNKNRIDKLSDPEQDFNYDVKPTANITGNRLNGDGNKTQILTEGQPIGMFYGFKWTGMFDNNMQCIYEDINGDGQITDEDKTYLGSAQPKMEYGWNNTIRWKDLEISLFFRGIVGNKALNVARWADAAGKGSNGANVFMYDVNHFGRTTFFQNRFSDYYLEDASYLKLDNITIAYNVPLPENKYCKKLRLNFTVQNVFTVSGYTGMDPARVNTTSIDRTGIDDINFYPSTRQFQFGVNATF